MRSNGKKVWVEIHAQAIRHNFGVIKSLLNPKTKLFAVVKSNAYGHGLILFSNLASQLGVDGFCVDSIIEGLKLRENGIKKPILVLGPTLPPNSLEEAFRSKITLTVSNFEALDRFMRSKYKPDFHIKIDTGMHRQGFYNSELPEVIRKVKSQKSTHSTSPSAVSSGPNGSGLILSEAEGSNVKDRLTGIYTHFASAKDLNYPAFTDSQFSIFKKAIATFEKAGFRNLTKHAAATGATFINPEYHLDAVRVGIGLYGLYPSRELELQLGSKIRLKPVLSWHSVISEIKNIKAGDYIGYDLAERAQRPTRMAIVPIGYWHGFDRRFSDVGEVLIAGKRAKVLGKVSMDLIAVDITGVACTVGSRVTMIGSQGKEKITAQDSAQKIETTHYEMVTRINPLIERTLV